MIAVQLISKHNHVKLTCFVLLTVKRKSKKMTAFFCFVLHTCNKTIIRFRFCDIQIKQGLSKGYQPQALAEADNSYLDLDYSGYHKNLIQ